MKLRTKIIAGFAVIAAIGCILGAASALSTWGIARLSEEQELLHQSYMDAANVLTAHYEWRHSLTMAANTGSDFTGSTDPTACALGKWLASDSSKTEDDELERLFIAVKQPHDFIHSESKRISELVASGQQQEAARIFEENVLPSTNETISIIKQIEQRYVSLVNEKMMDIAQVQRVVTVSIIILILAALAASVSLSTRIIKSVMGPIQNITRCAETVAAGILDIHIDYTVADEIGQLGHSFLRMTEGMKEQSVVLDALSKGDYTTSISVRSEGDTVNKAINHMIDNTNSAIRTIHSAAEQVSAGASQVSIGAQALAVGSTEQASAVEELSASIVQVAEQAMKNSDRVMAATQYIQKAQVDIVSGNERMEQLTESMGKIRSASEQISSITKVVEDIAFQTNILALNAAIEAARAGTAGKGFAVVADEVRNLASKSTEAAQQTERLVQNTVDAVLDGTKITEQTAQVLHSLGGNSAQIGGIMEKVKQSSAEQAISIEQIQQGLGQVSSVVQTNAATAEESSATSEEMSAQAVILRNEVRKFKLDSDNEETFLSPALEESILETAFSQGKY